MKNYSFCVLQSRLLCHFVTIILGVDGGFLRLIYSFHFFRRLSYIGVISDSMKLNNHYATAPMVMLKSRMRVGKISPKYIHDT